MDTEHKIAAEVEQLRKQQALIVRAVRISLSLILLTLAVTCARAALRVPAMADILRDMLPNTPLPFVTQFVMGHAGAFLLAAVLLATLGIGLLVFSRAPGRSIVAATVVIVVLFVQWQVIVSAMQSPLVHLMGQLGEP
jgi:hypothetical protein